MLKITPPDFSGLWPGGYFEGNPLDPMAASGYGAFGFMSVLHVTWLACVKPYVNQTTRVLEIGPGRGAWTKAINSCAPKHIHAVDALPAEETKFWEYVGRADHIEYTVAADFSLDAVPDRSIDYFFSFGVFCHLHPDMSQAYISSLARKMVPGGHGFLMVADRDKYDALRARVGELSLKPALANIRRPRPAKLAYRVTEALTPHPSSFDKMSNLEKGRGRWHHLGISGAAGMLEEAEFTVLDRDMGVNHRDPVIHFQR